jgi:hypothetical protein
MVRDVEQHVDEQWHHDDYEHHNYWRRYQTIMAGLLWTIIVILVVIWLVGFLLVHVGGSLIHLILVIAVILLVINLLSGRGARV